MIGFIVWFCLLYFDYYQRLGQPNYASVKIFNEPKPLTVARYEGVSIMSMRPLNFWLFFFSSIISQKSLFWILLIAIFLLVAFPLFANPTYGETPAAQSFWQSPQPVSLGLLCNQKSTSHSPIPFPLFSFGGYSVLIPGGITNTAATKEPATTWQTRRQSMLTRSISRGVSSASNAQRSRLYHLYFPFWVAWK